MARLTYGIVDGQGVLGSSDLPNGSPTPAWRIARRFEPMRIILFGAVASGNDAPDSDLDVLVVFDRFENRRRDLATAIQHELSDNGAPSRSWSSTAATSPGTAMFLACSASLSTKSRSSMSGP